MGADDSRSLKWGSVSDQAVSELEEVPKRPVYDDLRTEVMPEGPTRSELEEEWKQWTSTRNETTLLETERVVKIASGLDFVLALKANGEVWFCRVTQDTRISSWEYVSDQLT